MKTDAFHKSVRRVVFAARSYLVICGPADYKDSKTRLAFCIGLEVSRDGKFYFRTRPINSSFTFQSRASLSIAVASISVTYPFWLLASHTIVINSTRFFFG